MAAGGVLLLLIGAIWLAREPRGSRPSAADLAERAASTPHEIAVQHGSSTPARAAAPRDEPAPSAIPPAPGPLEDRRLDWLQGIVVAEGGIPVRGARVVACRADSGDSTLLWQMDPGFHERLERVAEAGSGADGRFRFALPRGIPFDLEASAADGGEGAAPLRYAGEDVLLQLARHAVHGRLTRASDGAPIADALVRAFTWPSYASRTSRSGADGRYRVTFPFGAGLYVEVLPLAEEATQWTWFELGPDGEKELDFVLADGVAVVGRVTEAQSGRPLAGAIVGEGWQFRRAAVTDAEGRYRLPGIGGAGAYGLAAKARGHGMVKRMELPSVADGALHVDFELPLGWSASGRVVDRAGNPVANALVIASGHVGDKDGQLIETSACRSDGDGRFRVEDISPVPGRHNLTVSAPGFARSGRPLPDPVVGNESLVGEIVLVPPVLVSGRVLAADGKPLLEAEVGVSNEQTWRSARTDALGRFAFGDLEPGRYTLKASWNSRAARPDVELALTDGEMREGLELRIPRGESVSGRVVDERGAGLPGVNVHAELYEARVPEEEPEEPAYFYETTDETGAFRFEDLLAGEYAVQAHPQGIQSDPDAPWLSGGARAKTNSDPVEIVLVKGATIRGHVLDASGAPLVNFTVSGHGPEGPRTWASGTDAQGRFELWVERDAVLDLVVSGPWQGADADKALLVERGVSAGTQGLELRLLPR